MSLASLSRDVREILLADWNPIGIRDVPQARDEYDAYVLPIAHILASGTTVTELADHLLDFEKDAFGLGGNYDRANRAALLLLRIP